MNEEKREQKILELSADQLNGVSGGAGGGVTSQGSFTSNTGTNLDICVDWRVLSGGSGGKTLQIDVSTVSYKLYTSADANGVQLSVNGVYYYGASNAINYGGSGKVTNPLCSFTVPNVSGSVMLSVVWYFKGTYSGISLQQISAAAAIYV